MEQTGDAQRTPSLLHDKGNKKQDALKSGTSQRW